MAPITSESFLFNDKKYNNRGRKKIDESGRSELDIDSVLVRRRCPKFLGENVTVDDDDVDDDVDDGDDDVDDDVDGDVKRRKIGAS